MAALVVLLGSVMFAATNGGGLLGNPELTPASAQATTPPVSASPPPAEAEEAWSDLALAPLNPIAALVPSNADRIGIARTSTFTLTSKTALDAVSLAKGLTATPTIAFTIKPGADRSTAILVPKTPLLSGTSYRLTLRTPDTALAGSWLFQTERPLGVAYTLPGDQATEVPTNTGIEVTFDQDGVGPIAPFFAIEPAVKGSFVQRGRTWAFVPQKPLAAATIYTVTVRHGVTLDGSDQVLGADFRFSFETLAAGQNPSGDELRPLGASFPMLMTEVVPAEPPVIEVYVDQPWSPTDTRKPVQSLNLRIFRLSGLPAAIDAYRKLSAAPTWAQTSDQQLVSATGLPLVASFTASVHSIKSPGYGETVSYVEFPGRLDRGWYLVVRPRSDARDQQVILQVTDVATYLATTTTRSVLWVNDVTSGGPIAGATLSSAAGRTIATTAADGTATPALPEGNVFIVTAPDAGSPGAATKAGRAMILPLPVVDVRPMDCASWGWGGSEKYWSVLATDRTRFRATDEIDAWGMIRPRNGGTASKVELRLSLDTWECGQTEADIRALAVVRVPVTAGSTTGTFATPLKLRDVPPGWYRLELWAGNERIAVRGIGVGEIRKPSYTFAVSTDRHVLVDGDTVTATVSSRFFDGTPLPALDVNLEGRDVGEQRATTSADGEIRLNLSTTWGNEPREGSSVRAVSVTPTMPEEAEVPNQSAGYVVFPSRLLLDGKAVIDGSALRISGSARVLDQEGAERQWIASAGSEWDPKGPVVGGARLGVEVIDTSWVPVKTGRSYDFIAKTAYDTYRYDRKELVLAKTSVVTGPDGTFTLSVARAAAGLTPPKGHDYKVTLTGRDSSGRVVVAERYAYAPWNEPTERTEADGPFARLAFAAEPEQPPYSVGEEIRKTLTWRGTEAPTGGDNRYLFFTGIRGLHTAEVWPTPTFVHTFSDSDIPNFEIGAVWFTGRHFVVADRTWAEFDRVDREIKLTLTPDSPRHAPGDSVRLEVRTATAAGDPVAATVVLRAIDEKLYAIDAAWPEDPLEQAYQWVSSGINQTYASHPLPAGSFGGGGGDAGGGGGGTPPGVRQDFRDAVLFEKISTAADGRGSVTFKLSDDVTSWRISGAAFTGDLRAGQASCSVASGLPFFIEAPLAEEYLASDRPTLLVRAYGTALSGGQAVTFTVSAPTLGMARTTVRGPAFTQIAVPLPALPLGEHAIKVEATTGTGGQAVGDAVVRTIRVVETRFTRRESASVVLPAALPVPQGAGVATYVFSDAGRGKYLAALQGLAGSGGDRVDQALAALIARDVLKSAFSIEDGGGGAAATLSRYQKEVRSADGAVGAGIALLPYASADLALSARVSLLAAERFDVWQLASYLSWVRDVPASTREEKNLALAGLAGIDAQRPSPLEIAAAVRAPDLTARERLYLALAAATSGDHSLALTVERELLDTYGQRLGPWVRLRVSSSPDEMLEATSLLALVAVTVGDPIADSAEAYVEEHYSTADLYQLQQAAFLRQAVAWAPAAAARFSYSVGTGTQVVDLAAGATRVLRLTPAQAATFSAKILGGRVGVTVSWDQPTTTSVVEIDPGLSIVRTVTPESPVPAGSVVKVVLTPRFEDLTITGCYRVVDLVPSGLRPVAWTYDSKAGSEDVPPWVISGQKVVFCAWPGPGRPPRLVYYARVVTPGAYKWEPAVMQSSRAPESGALTPTRWITLE